MLIKRKKIPVFKMLSIGLFPSFLKKIVYRMKGYEIGKNVTIGLGSVIIGKMFQLKTMLKLDLFQLLEREKFR